jgi:adenylylsulfate kinase
VTSDLDDVRTTSLEPVGNHGAGLTLWLTGLPSAGKSTIARGVVSRLCSDGRRVHLLDGDEIRRTLCADLGFSRADRIENVRRIGSLAMTHAARGDVAVVPVIAPYRASRDATRRHHAEHAVRYVEVYVATPVEECARRDVKGLYARQRRGELTGLTGVDDPYEPPLHPELTVDTENRSVDASVDAVLAYLVGSLRL